MFKYSESSAAAPTRLRVAVAEAIRPVTRVAAELVSMNVDIIVTSGNVASLYAKKATAKIPIVFMIVAEPVGLKLVERAPPEPYFRSVLQILLAQVLI